MKNQVKNLTNNIFITNNNNMLSYNLKYLFKLNKEKNNLKIIDFCRKSGINQNTVTTWIQNKKYPNKSNLQLLIDYFNKNLALNISLENIINNSIEIAALVVKESKSDYLTEDEKQIIEKYRHLENHKKDTIKKLLNDFE